MAIAHVAAGSVATGTTPLSVPYPAGIAANQMLVLAIANKYPANAPTTPSGWSLLAAAQGSGGHGSSGADTGNVYISVYYKIADGSETGSLSVTITSANSAVGRMFSYSIDSGNSWATPTARGKANNTASSSWSVTSSTDPSLVANDMEVVCSAINSDGWTPWSSEALSCSGVTFGTVTERADDSTTAGDDCALVVCDALVTAGPSAGNITFTMSGTGAGTLDAPAGATVWLRLRELNNYVLTCDTVSFAETVEPVGLTQQYKVTCDAVIFAETLEPVGLTQQYKLVLDTVSFVETVEPVGLVATYVMALATISFTETLESVGLAATYKLALDTVTYALDAQDVQLFYSGDDAIVANFPARLWLRRPVLDGRS